MKFTKYEGNPILSAHPDHPWEDLCTLNPAAVHDGERFWLLYRAAGHDVGHTIRLGLAVSDDGFHFTRCSDEPVLSPDPIGPDAGGCEDPRLVKMGKFYYLTYASRTFLPGQYWLPEHKYLGFTAEPGPAYLNSNASVTHLAISEDLVHWKKLGRMTDSRVDNRDAILFPEKIAGRYWMISRPMDWFGPGYGCDMPSMWVSASDDLVEWRDYRLLATGTQGWESKKIGGSAPPLRTDRGWLFLYHGVDKRDDAYRVGALLLDLNNPTKILARTKDWLMEPEFDYETQGYYNGCVFPCGNVIVGDTLYVYYGAADKFCCAATCSLSALLDHLLSDACAV